MFIDGEAHRRTRACVVYILSVCSRMVLGWKWDRATPVATLGVDRVIYESDDLIRSSSETAVLAAVEWESKKINHSINVRNTKEALEF